MATSNNSVIISRIQNRRGLKQDLPKPLRPGELGFATDSRQVFIGADTASLVNTDFNKIAQFEKTNNAENTVKNLANVQIIKFEVPNKFYAKGNATWDGITKTTSWTGSSVFKTSNTEFRHLDTALVFDSDDMIVAKDGIVLDPDSATSSASSVASSKDYAFIQDGTASGSSHNLGFRSAPQTTEQIGASYYGNATLISALSKTSPDTDVGAYVTGVTSFYNDATLWPNLTTQVLPSYRYLNNKNIRVTQSTGIGYIGLDFKHIAVSTDIKKTSADANKTGLTLGNLFLSRELDIQSSKAMTVAGSTATITVGATNVGKYDSANLNHVYTSGLSGWSDGKVLKVSAIGATTIDATLPTNTASIARSVTSYDTLTNTTHLSMTVSNAENIEVGDGIVFLNATGNTAVDSGTVTAIPLSGTAGIEVGSLTNTATVNALASSKFVTHKSGTNTTPVVHSTYHGFNNTEVANFGGNADYSSSETVSSATANTFVVTAGNAVASGDPALTITPVVANGTTSATPVTAVNLSAETTLNGAITKINNVNTWPKLNLVPNDDDKVYLTISESYQKTNSLDGFRIHQDSISTASSLGLTAGAYLKDDSTVKSKLETWLYNALQDTNFNYFKNIYVAQPYASSPVSFTSWALSIDSDLKEVNFNTREEARDFSTITNNLYFNSVNPDIKGLLNIKTNIELLTKDSSESGEAITSFSSPEGLTVANGNTVIWTANASTYDSFIIEYSMKDKSASVNETYKRIGTTMIGADTDSKQVFINDTYSDHHANITGNVNFTVSMASDGTDIISLNANNSLTSSTDCQMRYILRRWQTTVTT